MFLSFILSDQLPLGSKVLETSAAVASCASTQNFVVHPGRNHVTAATPKALPLVQFSLSCLTQARAIHLVVFVRRQSQHFHHCRPSFVVSAVVIVQQVGGDMRQLVQVRLPKIAGVQLVQSCVDSDLNRKRGSIAVHRHSSGERSTAAANHAI